MLLLAEHGDDDEEEEEEDQEDQEATGPDDGTGTQKVKAKAKEPAHLNGAWADGCYYRGDGSVAYYEGACPDDPYAMVHVA